MRIEKTVGTTQWLQPKMRKRSCVLKFIYSEKATKFCEIFTLLLSYVVPVKSKVKILQNSVAISEYTKFKRPSITICTPKFSDLPTALHSVEENDAKLHHHLDQEKIVVFVVGPQLYWMKRCLWGFKFF